MILDCTAEYIVEGDTILVAAYVYDQEEETYHPELVKSGSARLLSLGQSIAPVVKFDRKMGNADGSFKFAYSHPAKTQNLQLEISVELMDGAEFKKTVGVTESVEEEMPLSRNLLQEPVDTNSIRRAEEDLL